ncbi:MAG: acetylxylan esterase [Bacteroidetes bacterium]|nr:acetylxylan esterase [Bacteroidota bacterium]
MKRRISLLPIVILTTIYLQVPAQPTVSAGFPVNYNEDSVGVYTLPDPLFLSSRQRITTIDAWEQHRTELLSLIEEIQFGKAPSLPTSLQYNVTDSGTNVFNGLAYRKQITITLTETSSNHTVDILIYIPTSTKKPVPLFLNVSFVPNCITVADSGIRSGFFWTRDGKKVPAVPNDRFPTINVKKFLEAGFGFATLYYGDIEPDFKSGYRYGIRGYFDTTQYTWGSIAAWSWGISRVMDYFERDADIDAKRIALHGVSRLGKTVLWTGARDPRFSMIIACCSGEGGAALTRRNFGETIKHITDSSRYFYWFTETYHRYADSVEKLPFDAHILLALIAPRPLLLVTGKTDYWSDPKGEFLAAVAAEPVYRLYGKSGPVGTTPPQADDRKYLLPLGYYMHNGGHGPAPTDWDVYIEYMKRFL